MLNDFFSSAKTTYNFNMECVNPTCFQNCIMRQLAL